MTFPIVSFDTETPPGNKYSKVQPLICFSYADDAGAVAFDWRDSQAKGLFVHALSQCISVGVNIAYDVAVCLNEWPDLTELAWDAYEAGRIRDLTQCERLVCIADGHYLKACPGSLDDLAVKYGYGALDKDPSHRMTYGRYRSGCRYPEDPYDLDSTRWLPGTDTPFADWTEKQRQYPLHDVLAGRHIALAQRLPVDWENAARGDWCCFLMGAWGFRTDLARVARLRARYQTRLDEIVRELTTCGRPLPTGKALKDVTEYLQYALLRIDNHGIPHKNLKVAKARMVASGIDLDTVQTKGGDISTSESACYESGDPLLRKYASYSSIGKRLGTDLLALTAGEIHCWFKPVMENNQTSCSTPYNAQNPPTEAADYDGETWEVAERECIIPRPGHCFLDLDYNLFHLRTFSQVCLDIVGHSTMADFLNGGTRNMHQYVGAGIANVPYEDFDKKGKHKLYYDTAKRLNFGGLADMGYDRYCTTLRKEHLPLIAKEEFYKQKNLWKSSWPETWDYFAYIQSLGDGAQITELYTGRQRGGCTYTDAANGYFSALAASAAKKAWFRIARECYDPSRGSILLGDRPVIFIHDQFIIESPWNEAAHDHAMRVKEIMEQEPRDMLPDVPPTTDPCLASCLSKKAESVFDEHGRLLVWSPEEVA